jgi:hypothetical protein
VDLLKRNAAVIERDATVPKHFESDQFGCSDGTAGGPPFRLFVGEHTRLDDATPVRQR